MKRTRSLSLLGALALGCAGDLVEQLPPTSADSRPGLSIATAGDSFTSGDLALLDADGTLHRGLPVVSGDALIFDWGGAPAVLNSANQDNVTWFSGDGRTVLGQLRLRLDSEPLGIENPRDLLPLDAQRAWIARYGRSALVLVDRSSSAIVQQSDLAPLAEGAALVAPRRLALVQGELWVGLGRLGPGFATEGTRSAIGRVHPGTGALLDSDPSREGVQPIELDAPNLVGSLEVVGGRVLVACVGDYHRIDDGSVEEIDLATHARVGTAVTEREVEGNIDAAIALDADRLLLRVAGQATAQLDIASTRLVEWSRRERRILRVWLEVAGWTLTDPLLGGDGRVYVGDRGAVDRSRPSGIRTFDPASGREVAPSRSVGLPPYSLAWRNR